MQQQAAGGQTFLFCPFVGCPYHRETPNAKSFKKQLFLKQHVANKHSDKEFTCPLCGKCYAFSWQLKHHRSSCGRIWSCLSCDKTYSERLSLVVHCKRHRHTLPDDAVGWSEKRKCEKRKKDTGHTVMLLPVLVPVPVMQSAPQERTILPKSSSQTASTIATQTSSEADSQTVQKENIRSRTYEKQVSTQTEKKRRSTSAQCPPIRSLASRSRGQQSTQSIETQTLESILSSTGLTCFSESNPQVEKSRASIMPLAPGPLDSITGRSETSAQTDDLVFGTTIETQTYDSDPSLFQTNFDPDDFFLELSLNDTETQTIWNTDEATDDMFTNSLY